MPSSPVASTRSQAPQAPISAPVSAKAQAEFLQLKSSLDFLSWDLAPSGYEHLAMHFTEAGTEAQARLVAQALQ